MIVKLHIFRELLTDHEDYFSGMSFYINFEQS